MMKVLVWGPVCFVSLYMILPSLITRMLGISAMRSGKDLSQVALTFDDGPHPSFTPQLLDLLRTYQAKATFFVLGANAERYPELIKRIHDEGHQIGIHNYTHQCNWLLPPWTVKRHHIDRTANMIQSIIGIRPTYYRPPWGLINLFDFFWLRDFTLVYWSIMGGDWSKSIAKYTLKNKLLKRNLSGKVILLHDNGDTVGAHKQAPNYMLRALGEALAPLKARNLQFVRLDEMKASSSKVKTGRVKKLIVTLWLIWEHLFITLFRIRSVDQNHPLLKVRVREYKGNQPLVFEDGEEIHRGDRVVEMHLDNKLLFQLGHASNSTVHLATQLIRQIQHVMPQVLHLLQTDPKYQDVKGLYGVSMIHRGTRQLGFSVIDLPDGLFAWLTRFYLRLLFYVIHPQASESFKSKSSVLVPKIIAISKKQMIDRIKKC